MNIIQSPHEKNLPRFFLPALIFQLLSSIKSQAQGQLGCYAMLPGTLNNSTYALQGGGGGFILLSEPKKFNYFNLRGGFDLYIAGMGHTTVSGLPLKSPWSGTGKQEFPIHLAALIC